MKTTTKNTNANACLITGSTGFVGKNVLKEILLNHYDSFEEIILLIRPTKYSSASQRGAQILKNLQLGQEQYRIKKVRILASEITKDYLGLTSDVYDQLVQSVDVIFHSAATVKYNLPYEEAGYININGTLNLLTLAHRCMTEGRFKRFNHISTAYVTGNQKNRSVLRKKFLNTYEQTKYDAEEKVLDYIRKGLPGTIFRPSIITGDSVTGEIMRTNVLFKFIKLFESEALTYFPCDEGASLNIIPIDYFINVLFKLCNLEESIGRTFNISNHNNIDVRQSIAFKCNELNVQVPQFVPSERLDLIPEKIRHNLAYILAYVNESHWFDLSTTYNLLDEDMPQCPEWETYFDTIIQYCKDNGFVKDNKKEETLLFL